MKKNDTSFLDRVFLHSKNADERLFDMILRIITFIVLIIIVWLYADLAHVKAASLTVDEYVLSNGNQYNLKWYFNDSDYSNMANLFSDIPYNSNYNFGQVNIPGKVVVTDDMNFDDYYFVQARGIPNASQSLFTVFIPKSVDVAIIDYNKIYSSETCSCYYVWADKTDSLNTSKYYRVDLTLNEGVNDYSWLSSLDFNYFFGNIPYLKGSNISAVDYFENGNNFDVSYNANYLMYHDLIMDPNSLVVESSKNHLALSDCQIGITAFDKELTDLSESSVVIGLACNDNWILSHENDYTVLVQYDFYLKDSNLSQSDPVSFYAQTFPLSAFKTEPITESMANIMVNSMVAPFPSNRDFYSYYRSLNSTYGQKVVSERTFNYNGLLPTTIDKVRAFLIGSYSVTNEVTPNNTIFEFYLDVNVRLSAEGESGGYFTKRFDFKRGTTSILSADAYQNPNPWEGESNPLIEYDPQVPAVGSGGSSSVTGGNTSVVVNNNGGKVPINVHNQSQLDDCVRRYNEVRQVFFADIQAIAADTGSNNFIRVLNEAMPQIPGMSIYMTYVSLICFVALILIVLKVLLF